MFVRSVAISASNAAASAVDTVLSAVDAVIAMAKRAVAALMRALFNESAPTQNTSKEEVHLSVDQVVDENSNNNEPVGLSSLEETPDFPPLVLTSFAELESASADAVVAELVACTRYLASLPERTPHGATATELNRDGMELMRVSEHGHFVRFMLPACTTLAGIAATQAYMATYSTVLDTFLERAKELNLY